MASDGWNFGWNFGTSGGARRWLVVVEGSLGSVRVLKTLTEPTRPLTIPKHLSYVLFVRSPVSRTRWRSTGVLSVSRSTSLRARQALLSNSFGSNRANSDTKVCCVLQGVASNVPQANFFSTQLWCLVGPLIQCVIHYSEIHKSDLICLITL